MDAWMVSYMRQNVRYYWLQLQKWEDVYFTVNQNEQSEDIRSDDLNY